MCYFEVHTLFAVLEVEGDCLALWCCGGVYCFAEFVQAEKGFFVVDTIKADGVDGADAGGGVGGIEVEFVEVDIMFTVSPTP